MLGLYFLKVKVGVTIIIIVTTVVTIIVRLMLVSESSISHNEKNINHNCIMSSINCCHYPRGQESIKVHLSGHSHADCSSSNMSILLSMST